MNFQKALIWLIVDPGGLNVELVGNVPRRPNRTRRAGSLGPADIGEIMRMSLPATVLLVLVCAGAASAQTWQPPSETSAVPRSGAPTTSEGLAIT